MKYLEIENGRIEGWKAPMYYEIVKFANEVKQVCIKGLCTVGETMTPAGTVKARKTNYKYPDGTRFIIAENEEGEIVKIEAKDSYGGDWELLFVDH